MYEAMINVWSWVVGYSNALPLDVYVHYEFQWLMGMYGGDAGSTQGIIDSSVRERGGSDKAAQLV